MRSNLPPGAAEDPTAPYNEKTKVIEVNISQSLSTIVEIVVPEDFDETDDVALELAVREQIVLPSEVALKYSPDCWYVDEFSVCCD